MFQLIAGSIHVRHAKHFVMRRMQGVPEFLLLLIKSDATFIINQQQYTVTPQSILIIDRNTPYEYFNPDGEYIDDWLHFDIHDQKTIAKLSPLLNQIFSSPKIKQLESYLQLLLWENAYAPNRQKNVNTEAILTVLLNNLIDAYDNRHNAIQSNPYYRDFQALRLEIQNDVTLSVSASDAAVQLGISVSHFHHLYREFFQTTFRNDAIGFRIEQVKKLLTTTELTIEEIQTVCGYQQPIHFFRQFKEHTKITPGAYREYYQNKPI